MVEFTRFADPQQSTQPAFAHLPGVESFAIPIRSTLLEVNRVPNCRRDLYHADAHSRGAEFRTLRDAITNALDRSRVSKDLWKITPPGKRPLRYCPTNSYGSIKSFAQSR